MTSSPVGRTRTRAVRPRTAEPWLASEASPASAYGPGVGWTDHVPAVGARAPRFCWEDDDTVPSARPGPAEVRSPDLAPRRAAPAAADHPLLYGALGIALGLVITAAVVGFVWWLAII